MNDITETMKELLTMASTGKVDPQFVTTATLMEILNSMIRTEEIMARIATALETHTLRFAEHGTLHNDLAKTFNDHVFKYHTQEAG